MLRPPEKLCCILVLGEFIQDSGVSIIWEYNGAFFAVCLSKADAQLLCSSFLSCLPEGRQ